MCHRFGQRKRGTKFVTFRFSYFDACARARARGERCLLNNRGGAPTSRTPVPAPPPGSTRQWDNLSEEVSNTKHNDTTSPTTHTIRSRLTKCVTCATPRTASFSTSAPSSGHRSSDHPSCELATQSRRLNRRYRRGPREGRIGMCPPLECPRER